MGLLSNAREVKKYDMEAEKITGYKLGTDAELPDNVAEYFDTYVAARKAGESKKTSARLASRKSGWIKLKKAKRR